MPNKPIPNRNTMASPTTAVPAGRAVKKWRSNISAQKWCPPAGLMGLSVSANDFWSRQHPLRHVTFC